jgi:uncharacterized protein (TIGR03437 family)
VPDDSPSINDGGIVQNGFSIPLIQRVSAGAITSIYGARFAPDGSGYVSGALVNGSLPTKVAKVCVTFGGVMAPVFTVSPGQLTVQVPRVQAGTDVAVQVLKNCGEAGELKSNVATVKAAAATPEFLYLRNSGDGVNPVIALNSGGQFIGPSGAVPGVTLAPAKPGDVLTLYALGFGDTDPLAVPGAALNTAASLAQPFAVSIGGMQLAAADVLYAGIAPGWNGLYQLNLRVPAGLPEGNQSVVIQVGDASSPSGAFLAIGH